LDKEFDGNIGMWRLTTKHPKEKFGVKFVSARRVNDDSAAHRISCSDPNAPYQFGTAGEQGKLNQKGADFGLLRLGNIGTWNYACGLHPQHTGTFSGTVETRYFVYCL
jgi:hypothetical protein